MARRKINVKVIKKMAERLEKSMNAGRVKYGDHIKKVLGVTPMISAFKKNGAWLKSGKYGKYSWTTKITDKWCKDVLFTFVKTRGGVIDNYPDLRGMGSQKDIFANAEKSNKKLNKSKSTEPPATDSSQDSQQSNEHLASTIEEFMNVLIKNGNDMNSVKAAMFDHNTEIKTLIGRMDAMESRVDEVLQAIKHIKPKEEIDS